MKSIEIKNLVKSYGQIKALDGLNLAIPEGSLFGLLGPNGAGKTTAIRILCTLLAPTSGQVIVDGIDALICPREVRQKLGYLAQEVALDKILTGRELLDLQGSLYHLQSLEKNKRIKELIDLLEMTEWIDRRCGTYSGGMKRRLDLATCLLHKPKILILDEPTVGLDIESRTAIWQLLQNLKSEGTTILLSSHYLEEVDALADHIAIIDNGSVIASGTPTQLKQKLGGYRITLKVREFSDPIESEKVRKVLENINGVRQVVVNQWQGFSLNLVVDDLDVVTHIRDKLHQSELQVFALSHSRPSLDDVYLQATGRTLMDAEMIGVSQRDLKMESKISMR